MEPAGQMAALHKVIQVSRHSSREASDVLDACIKLLGSLAQAGKALPKDLNVALVGVLSRYVFIVVAPGLQPSSNSSCKSSACAVQLFTL